MREEDGRKLDHQTLEALRLRAVEQVARGVSAAEVGAGLAALGLHRRTIYTWLAKERTEGRQALRAKPVPGPARKLSAEQRRELGALIVDSDPRDHGFAVALWTREIVRQLIAARFGVALTVASVGRTLKTLGFSAQRPLYRAEQADPAAVRRWRKTAMHGDIHTVRVYLTIMIVMCYKEKELQEAQGEQETITTCMTARV